MQTVQKMGDSTGAVLLEVVETPADVSTTGVLDRIALAWEDSGYMFCDSSLAVCAGRHTKLTVKQPPSCTSDKQPLAQPRKPRAKELAL